MRTIFLGTPDIAVPAMKALAVTTELVAVVCQPDRRAGRGMKLRHPPVKTAAIELGLPVHQPSKVRTGFDEWIREQDVEVAVVMAYGRIVPQTVLDAPRRGCMNLHASVLPKFRGAAPIQWAVIERATETGIALMQMDAGMDTGPVFCDRRIPVGATETSGELAERLADLGAEVIRQDLPRVLSGDLVARAQDGTLATHARKIEKSDAWLDWNLSAEQVTGWINGLSPYPGAKTLLGEKQLVVFRGESIAGESGAMPGTVLEARGDTLAITAGDGAVRILEGRVGNGKRVGTRDLLNALHLAGGERLVRPDPSPADGAGGAGGDNP